MAGRQVVRHVQNTHRGIRWRRTIREGQAQSQELHQERDLGKNGGKNDDGSFYAGYASDRNEYLPHDADDK